MPYRRYASRRRSMRRRGMRSRRLRLSRPSRGIVSRMKVNHFKRMFELEDIVSTTTGLGFAYPITFSQLPDVTDFTNLYDGYRINKIVLKFMPTINQNFIGNTGYELTQFHSVIDPNEASVPSTADELYQYRTHRMTRSSQTHTRVYTPAILLESQNSSNQAEPAGIKWKQWLSTNYIDINHYGAKIWADPTANAGDVVWKVYATMYFSCRFIK